METYKITSVNLKSKVTSEIEIYEDECESTGNIILSTNIDGTTIIKEDYNYLTAFGKLRDELLDMGYGLKCKGAVVGALQSGMMGANDKIYLVTLGKQALNKDIVSIYDYAEIDTFATSKEQEEFTEEWFKSLREKNK